MTLRRGCVLGAILVASAAVAVWAYLADRSERSIHVTIDCAGRSCQASIDGGDPLRLELPAVPGEQIGVYAYHPFEFDRPQGVQAIVLRRAGIPDAEIRVRFAPGAWTPAGWHGDPGWGMTERGFAHAGPLGELLGRQRIRTALDRIPVVVEPGSYFGSERGQRHFSGWPARVRARDRRIGHLLGMERERPAR